MVEEFIAKAKERISPFPCEGFVAGNGPVSAKILIVGEAPGKTEMKTGEPFTGSSGRFLDDCFAIAGLTREDMFITSVVRSRPYKENGQRDRQGNLPNRPPSKGEIIAHAPLLDMHVQLIQPEMIITLGNVALRRLTGMTKNISALHGQLLHVPLSMYDENSGHFKMGKKSYTLLPMYHPAAALHNPALKEQIQLDWKQVKSLRERKSDAK
ncbi:uracil-DNA glycosylase [Bacillaceae bacterium SIJ1]|uniref:uracil-DNA glycosylase n=1 Tax=Litoribacterium kuwaitense TaxID=1398745 RepID=UPI0013EBBC80|nr:uracil-DNA glycosylase [Litoribacterium kuwaitense]NGP43913.1 uracil-DNA glycosylase [Litoribacterium kuwaitense]